MKRRNFLGTFAAAGAGSVLTANKLQANNIQTINPVKNPIPRWRGFNLQWMLAYSRNATPLEVYRKRWKEEHLEWMQKWGFDHVRLGTSYVDLLDQSLLEGGTKGDIVKAENILKIDRERLACLRECVDLMIKNGIHVDLCMHRLPGDAIWNHQWEPFGLYRDTRGDEAIAFWWGELAKEFADIPSEKLTFNLLNELPHHWEKRAGRDHLRRSMMIGVDAVRAISPDRIIFIDGTSAGREFLENMIDDPVAHSVHAYMPMEMSHYAHHGKGKATWPLLDEKGRTLWGRNRLEARYAGFAKAAELGGGIHCGEMGAQKELPPEYFMPWMKDHLEILYKYQIGYALWNFVGGFGVLNTRREGMKKEKFKGMDLDIELLELLQAH